MKEKMSLDTIVVKSFVTAVATKQVKGGFTQFPVCLDQTDLTTCVLVSNCCQPTLLSFCCAQ